MQRLDTLPKIRDSILQMLPEEAKITKVEFEGPEIAIYSKNPLLFIENSDLVRNIVKTIKKRVVVRSDPEVRRPFDETEKTIRSQIPEEAEITEISFDETVGEVIIEAKKPGLVIGKSGSNLRQLAAMTSWRPAVIRTPPLKSAIVEQTLDILKKESTYKQNFLRAVGHRIHRHVLFKGGWVTVTPLGGAQEVGRSATLVQTSESQVLIDCGIKPSGNGMEEYPKLDAPVFDMSKLDAVVISHAHLDHCGLLPFLFKYGYRGPVYCTKPTLSLMTLLQWDYLEIANKTGSPPPYSLKDMKRGILHTIPLEFGEVTDISPDIKLTFHNAGHVLGSAMVHLHVGEGLHNIVFTGDFKFGHTRLLEGASSTFPRLETLIMEATYGNPSDHQPPREEAEAMFLSWVRQTLEGGGKVLLPVLAVGRSQEIMMILEEALRSRQLPEVPIYIEGLVQEASAIHTAYPEYLAHELRDKIFHDGVNPFLSEFFIRVDDRNARSEIVEGGPCLVMATSGMLNGGPAQEYFRLMASDPKNSVIFTCYQISGTLGSRIQRGLREVQFNTRDGRTEMVKVESQILSAEGFSGHSDYRQLNRFIQRVSPKPENIIVVHGEKGKTQHLASTISRVYRASSRAPAVLETVRLC